MPRRHCVSILQVCARSSPTISVPRVIQTLADVFRSDSEVSVLEVDFFNRVAESLQVTAAQVAGLRAGNVGNG